MPHQEDIETEAEILIQMYLGVACRRLEEKVFMIPSSQGIPLFYCIRVLLPNHKEESCTSKY